MEGDIYRYFFVIGSGSLIKQRFEFLIVVEEGSEVVFVKVSIG